MHLVVDLVATKKIMSIAWERFWLDWEICWAILVAYPNLLQRLGPHLSAAIVPPARFQHSPDWCSLYNVMLLIQKASWR